MRGFVPVPDAVFELEQRLIDDTDLASWRELVQSTVNLIWEFGASYGRQGGPIPLTAIKVARAEWKDNQKVAPK